MDKLLTHAAAAPGALLADHELVPVGVERVEDLTQRNEEREPRTKNKNKKKLGMFTTQVQIRTILVILMYVAEHGVHFIRTLSRLSEKWACARAHRHTYLDSKKKNSSGGEKENPKRGSKYSNAEEGGGGGGERVTSLHEHTYTMYTSLWRGASEKGVWPTISESLKRVEGSQPLREHKPNTCLSVPTTKVLPNIP